MYIRNFGILFWVRIPVYIMINFNCSICIQYLQKSGTVSSKIITSNFHLYNIVDSNYSGNQLIGLKHKENRSFLNDLDLNGNRVSFYSTSSYMNSSNNTEFDLILETLTPQAAEYLKSFDVNQRANFIESYYKNPAKYEGVEDIIPILSAVVPAGGEGPGNASGSNNGENRGPGRAVAGIIPSGSDSDGESYGGSNTSVDRTSPVSQPNSLVNYDTLNLYHDSQDLKKISDLVFNEYMISNNVYIIPTESLAHFKDRNNASVLINSSDLFTRYQLYKDLQKLYIQGIYDTFDTLIPIPDSYIRELDRRIVSNESNASLPINQLNPAGVNTVGKVVYGLAHGAHELIHFMKSTSNKVNYKLYFKGEDFSLSANLEIPNTNVNTRYECNAFSFDIEIPYSKSKNNNSIFNHSTEMSVYNDLYEIKGYIKPVFSYSVESSRRGFVSRKDGKNQFIETNEYNVYSLGGTKISQYDKNIADFIAPLFFLDTVDMVNRLDIVQYVSSNIYKYAKDQVVAKPGLKLQELVVVLEITRKQHDNVKQFYIDCIDKGKIIPLTPIHYNMYLSDKFSESKWLPFSFLSSVANVNINQKLISVLPSMDIESKSFGSLYAMDRERLKSDYYVSDVALPFQKSQKFSIDFKTYMKEMYVKTLLNESVPGYFMFLSDGKWTHGDVRSSVVNPANINSYLCKFGLEDNYKIVRKMTEYFALTQGGIVKSPYYVKRLTRLTSHMPSIFERFVPGIEQTIDVVESISDSYGTDSFYVGDEDDE